MSTKKVKDIFVEGAIQPQFIAESIAHHSSKTGIGGHSIFLGQIRADEVSGEAVKAIEYTANREMALELMTAIREECFSKYQITCLHVHHSLGLVPVGELCFFVFASSAHRKDAIEACNEIVERVKKELPIWGKEIFQSENYQWKINK